MSANFFDTNIILYLLDDNGKTPVAENILSKGGTVSVQVLNETLVNCKRKTDMTWSEIKKFIDAIRQICTVANLSEQTHELGRAIAERYMLSIYDSMIVASALESNSEVLYSEDMQDGMLIEGCLRVINPFKSSTPPQ